MIPSIGVSRCSRLDDYLSALRAAGAEPRVLEIGMDPAAALDGLQGLVLTGGADVDPRYYGETPHPRLEPAEPGRDEFEIDLVRRAVEGGLPVLAICRGVQAMNVAFGGTLVQDIPTQIPGAIPHAIADPKDALAHDVTIAEDSLLARLLVQTDRGSLQPVNSRHHQAVRQIAPGFAIVATAPDGVVEAIERPGASFCLGVQWHPENFWPTGRYRGLFEGFVSACRA